MKNKLFISAILTGTLALGSVPIVGLSASAAETSVLGDINADGTFNVSDAVALKKWLLGKKVTLADWKAGDLCEDEKLNVFDFNVMKNMLIEKQASGSTKTETASYSIKYNGTSAAIADTDGNAVSFVSAVSVNGAVVTISEPGEYTVSGKSDNGQLVVNVDKDKYPDGKVTLNFEGLELTNTTSAPLYVASIDDECAISVKKGTVNVLSDGTSHTDTYADSDGEENEIKSAVFCRDDLKIKGKGTLKVNGNTADGIVCKNDIKIQNGTVEVKAVDDGIVGKDSVRIGDDDDRSNDGTLVVNVTTENGDGIKSTNTKSETKGIVTINGGKITIDAHSDGISASRSIIVNGGDISIKTYEGDEYEAPSTGGMGNFQFPTDGQMPSWGDGSDFTPPSGDFQPPTDNSGNTGSDDNSSRPTPPGGFGGGQGNERGQGGQGGFPGGGGFGFDSGHDLGLDFSCKGMKAGDSDASIAGDITINGGTLNLNTTDDAVHCGGTLTVNDGDITIGTSDDALHSDKYLNVNNGKINITKSYEGLEAMQICMADGDITVYSEDDPVNAGEKGVKNQVDVANDNCIVQIDGGTIHAYVTNLQEGDGIDSNGKIVINGGDIYVEGSVNGPDSALDSDGEMLVNGGTVVAVGGLGRGELPEQTSQQNSVYWGSSKTSYPAGSVVALLDANGNEIVSYTSVQTLKCAVISSPDIRTGEKYTMTINGTKVAEFTVTSALTTQGDTGSDGPTGMQ